MSGALSSGIGRIRANVADKLKKSLAVHFSELIKENIN